MNGIMVIGNAYFSLRGKNTAFALHSIALPGHIIEAKDNILAGNNNWTAVGRGEDVIGRHHQNPGLDLCLHR